MVHSTPKTTSTKKKKKSEPYVHTISLRFVAQFQIPLLSPIKPPLRLFSSPFSSQPHICPPRRRAADPSHGKAPASTLPDSRARVRVRPSPARRAAARTVLPRCAEGRCLLRRRRQHDTSTTQRSRPSRRTAPARRGVVHPGRIDRPAGGAAVGAVLRHVRQRRPGLLRQRGPRQPQQGRAPRRGGPLPGGALRLAPRQGHPRPGPGTRGHPVRHRVGPQEPLEVALRGPAGLQAVGSRRDERRRRRQVEGQARCYWSEVEARGSSRQRPASGAEVRRPLRQHPRRCRASFPLCKILW